MSSNSRWFWILNTRSVSKLNTKIRVFHSNSNVMCMYEASPSLLYVQSLKSQVRKNVLEIKLIFGFHGPT